MSNNNNVVPVGTLTAYVIEGKNKYDEPYQAVQFGIMTEVGEYKTKLIFPSSLESALVIDAIRRGEE